MHSTELERVEWFSPGRVHKSMSFFPSSGAFFPPRVGLVVHGREIIPSLHGSSFDAVVELVGSIKESFNRLVSRYVPGITTIPLEQGFRFVPTWKTVPTHSLTKRVWIERMKLKPERVSGLRSIFTSFPHELGAFNFLMNFVHARGRGEQFSQGCLWPERTRYAIIKSSHQKI